MRLDEGEQITKTPLQSPSFDRLVATHFEQLSHENKTAHRLPENDSPPRDDYFAIVARATNDAVRDWDLKSGTVSWPHGIESLFGYEPAFARSNVGFWQKNVHPADRARIASAIHK